MVYDTWKKVQAVQGKVLRELVAAERKKVGPSGKVKVTDLMAKSWKDARVAAARAEFDKIKAAKEKKQSKSRRS